MASKGRIQKENLKEEISKKVKEQSNNINKKYPLKCDTNMMNLCKKDNSLKSNSKKKIKDRKEKLENKRSSINLMINSKRRLEK